MEQEDIEFVQEDDLEEVIELDENDQDTNREDDCEESLDEELLLPIDESIFSFEEHHESVFCCDISHDDKFAITGGQDDKAILWDTNSGEIKFETNGHKDSVVAVQFNKSSTMVATGDMSGMVFVWDLNGNKLHEFEVGELKWLQWHISLDNVLLAGTQATWMWKLSSNDFLCKMFDSFGYDNNVAKIFNDGKRIAMAYEDGSIRIGDLKETRFLTTITGNNAHKDSVITLDINSDDSLVATGSLDSTVKILNVKSQKIVSTLEMDQIECLIFGSQNNLIVGLLSGYIQIWHIPTLTKRNEIKFPMGITKIISDKQTSHIIYAAGLDCIFRIIDLRTCEIILEKTGHRDHILDFSISSDSKYALTCSDDSTCKIFKIQ